MCRIISVVTSSIKSSELYSLFVASKRRKYVFNMFFFMFNMYFLSWGRNFDVDKWVVVAVSLSRNRLDVPSIIMQHQSFSSAKKTSQCSYWIFKYIVLFLHLLFIDFYPVQKQKLQYMFSLLSLSLVYNFM